MPRKSRGSALIMALWLIVLMALFGLAVLAVSEQDYLFAGEQESSARSYYLAEAGLEFYRWNAGAIPIGSSVTRAVPSGDLNNFFEVEVAADGTIRSRGVVRSGLGSRVLGERTLVVPQGRFEDAYDASQ